MSVKVIIPTVPRVKSKVGGSTSGPTTTSGTFSLLPEMTITANTNGGDVLLMFQGAFNLQINDDLIISPFVDSVEISTTHRIRLAIVAGILSSVEVTMVGSINVLATGLSAGSHTFDIRWLASGGTARAYLTQRVFNIVEVI